MVTGEGQIFITTTFCHNSWRELDKDDGIAEYYVL